MADASKLPLVAGLYMGQWANKTTPTPKLAAQISATATIITVDAPLKNLSGTIVTGAFLVAIKKASGFAENIWVPASAVSADGLTLGTALIPVVRGVDPDGIDFTTGSSDFADSHIADEPVYCVVSAIIPELLRSSIQGLIATGAVDFVMGTEPGAGGETVTVYRTTTAGVKLGFLRWYLTSTKVEYSNDGAAWTAIDDTVASVLLKISSADTTPGYGEDKIQAGANVTITKINTGANEYLEISTSVGAAVDTHEVYTPAYMTGGASAESVIAIWDSVSDGEFDVTIDGTLKHVTACDFTAPVGDMDAVAAVIQAAIRVATSSTETCVWSTDHFIITSADTTSSSEISVTSAYGAGVGTDISGAGAGTYMDSDTGNGTASDPVLDPTADAGSLVKLDATGNLDHVFRGDAVILVAGESIDGTTTPQCIYISDGTVGTAGRVFKADADDLTNMGVRAVGFVTSNVTVGESVIVYIKGLVSGFTGLTPGVDYFLSITAGAISTTIQNAGVCVCRAISATEIKIMSLVPSIFVSFAYTDNEGSQGTTDTEISIGFRAKSISCVGGFYDVRNDITQYTVSNGLAHGLIEYGNRTNVTNVAGDYGAYLAKSLHTGGATGSVITVLSETDNTVTIRRVTTQDTSSGTNRNGGSLYFLILG